ncbi:MAG: hypothetical protein H3C36_00655 [Chitinophagaceae bacterium]|nr:hypothetical protein [Chitinophagaceae bacterium]
MVSALRLRSGRQWGNGERPSSQLRATMGNGECPSTSLRTTMGNGERRPSLVMVSEDEP